MKVNQQLIKEWRWLDFYHLRQPVRIWIKV